MNRLRTNEEIFEIKDGDKERWEGLLVKKKDKNGKECSEIVPVMQEWRDAYDSAYPEGEDTGIDGKPTYIAFVTVTPEMAKNALDKMNIDNFREVNTSNLDKIRADIKNGKFSPNNDTAVIRPFFIFSNAQHRLLACFEENIPIQLRVVFGNINELEMDTNYMRTYKQLLKKRKEVNAGDKSSAIPEITKQLLTVAPKKKADGWKEHNSSYSVRDELRELLVNFTANSEKVKEYEKTYKIGNRSKILGIYTLAARICRPVADLHLEYLYNRAATKDIPKEILIVAKALHNNQCETKGNKILKRYQRTAGVILTLNHMFTGKKIPRNGDWGCPRMIGLASMALAEGFVTKEDLPIFPVTYDILAADDMKAKDVPVYEAIIKIALAGEMSTYEDIHAALDTEHAVSAVTTIGKKLVKAGVITAKKKRGVGITFSTTEDKVYGYSHYIKPFLEEEPVGEVKTKGAVSAEPKVAPGTKKTASEKFFDKTEEEDIPGKKWNGKAELF